MFLGIGFILLIFAGAAAYIGFDADSKISKAVAVFLIILATISITVHFFTAQGQRMIKSWTSNTTGGLERIVEVYDQSGKLIRTYEGKLDVQENEFGNKVLFDLNGKRTIIYNATVIVQEK